MLKWKMRLDNHCRSKFAWTVLGSLVFIFSFPVFGQIDASKYQYKDQIGYLSPDNPDATSGFERCQTGLPVGFYSSPHEVIFKPNKRAFKRKIENEFNQKDFGFGDNGLLTIRFLINCKGEMGDYELRQMDYDFNPIQFVPELVEKLKGLTFQTGNWNYQAYEGDHDYYMYLIFRLKNGKVVEIIP